MTFEPGMAGTSGRDGILPVIAASAGFAVGRKTLVADLDLCINAHRRTFLVGPNGAGKSITLRLLHGLLKPTSGSISWGGRGYDASVRTAQAMVFQKPVLLRRTALGNVLFALRARGHSRREADHRAGQALDRAGLLSLAKVPARRLSGGEQQRLAVARAMALEPALLFLDEPTANLDPASTVEIEGLVRELSEAGTTVVMVSHDLGQTRRLAERVVFMNRGRIVEQTEAAGFFEAPESEQARAFIDGRIVL